MAIEDFFNHTCNIFHMKDISQKREYGLPDNKVFQYFNVPDIREQPCHFSVKSGTVSTVQREPQKELDARLKLTLPIDTDIRVNDKVVDCESGYEYEAEVPRNIRDHHIVVWIHRVHPKSV